MKNTVPSQSKIVTEIKIFHTESIVFNTYVTFIIRTVQIDIEKLTLSPEIPCMGTL